MRGKALWPWTLSGVNERLRYWWGFSYTLDEIARRLSLEFPAEFNRNMVVGRARRLGLPSHKKQACSSSANILL
jgi:hypothetical protein